MSFLDQFSNDKLNKLAKQARPRVHRWVGTQSGGSARRYVCYLCDEIIDIESAMYAPTKHAEVAISNHMQQHMGESDE